MLQRQLPQALLEGDPTDSITSATGGSSGPGWKRPMPRVSSMLFDLELDDQDAREETASPQISSRQLLKLLQPSGPAEHQLGVAVEAAYVATADGGEALTIDDLADTLRNSGHDVRIRTALGGGGGGECLRNLRHQFLTLNMTGADGVEVECIIDPSFAEQWGIARPTQAYARIVEALPQVYVGSCVEPLVDFLCSELAIAFKAEGATLPPWRSADAMLSKWRPRRSVDCDMLQPPVTPFDTASRSGSGGVSRCSLNQRPSKSQRLSSAGSDGGAAPHGSPLKGMGSGRCRSGSNLSAAGFSTGVAWALQKSASNALSDAEAQEAAAAGDASDSSNDSEMETVAGDDWRTGGGGVGRRSDLSKLSSSWRASDTVPFMPASPVSGGLRRASEERTSASDGSDTSQCGPAAPTVALPLRLQGRLGSAEPRLQPSSSPPPKDAAPKHRRSPSAPGPGQQAKPRTPSTVAPKGLPRRPSGGRPVKLVPPLQVLGGRTDGFIAPAAFSSSPAARAAAIRQQLGLRQPDCRKEQAA